MVITIPVLEIGGSHVTAALVDLDTARVERRYDLAVEPDANRDAILGRFAAAGRQLGLGEGRVWGVAIPGPFDYKHGVGRFTGVGKFESLNGVDVGSALREQLAATAIRFVNDADAFAIGEAAVGAARGHARALCLTLGSGVGSTFLADGLPVKSGDQVPPNGYVYTLSYNGRDLEDSMSRRALRRAYRLATGRNVDVAEIAQLVRTGDAEAARVWEAGFAALTGAIAPWIRRFGADIVVVGGAIATSWDLVGTAVAGGFAAASAPVVVVPAARPEDAALFGTARWAQT